MYKVTHPSGYGGQWFCGTIIAFCGFTTGLGMVWTAVFFPKVDSGEVGRTFTLLEATFIASFTHVGQLVSTFPSGYLQDKVGRRNTLIIAIQILLCAWILIFLSRTFWSITIARLFMGLWSGFTSTCCPAYLGEISSPLIRGRLSSLLTVLFTLGLIFQTSVGSFISYNAVAIISFFVTFLNLILLIIIPESPYSLLRHGKNEQAVKNLQWLRGNENIEDLYNYIKFNIDIQMSRKTTYKEMFSRKSSRKAFIQVLELNLFQRFSGFLALASFSSQIFPGDWFIFTSDKYPIIWTSTNLIFLTISFFILDYVDRKVLLTISSGIYTLFNILLVIWFYLYEKTTVDMSGTIWIPYISHISAAASYAFGLYFIPVVFIGEIFPMNIKSKATSLTIFISYIAAIIVVQSFLPMKHYIGMYSNFTVYAISSLICFFVCLTITETRNKTLEVIQSELEGGR